MTRWFTKDDLDREMKSVREKAKLRWTGGWAQDEWSEKYLPNPYANRMEKTTELRYDRGETWAHNFGNVAAGAASTVAGTVAGGLFGGPIGGALGAVTTAASEVFGGGVGAQFRGAHKEARGNPPTTKVTTYHTLGQNDQMKLETRNTQDLDTASALNQKNLLEMEVAGKLYSMDKKDMNRVGEINSQTNPETSTLLKEVKDDTDDSKLTYGNQMYRMYTHYKGRLQEKDPKKYDDEVRQAAWRNLLATGRYGYDNSYSTYRSAADLASPLYGNPSLPFNMQPLGPPPPPPPTAPK